MEKNPTIVNFPIKNFDLTDYLWEKETDKEIADSAKGDKK